MTILTTRVEFNPGWENQLDVEKEMSDIGNQVAEDARRMAPVETGALRDSIQSEVSGSGTETTVRVGSNLEYAIYVEMGTSNQGAQPFLRPAATKKR